MSDQKEDIEPTDLLCPFCDESGFDKAGLRHHLKCYCEQFEPERPDDMPGWWCFHCGEPVPNEHVTYEEIHDPRAGGCGYHLFGG